MNIRDWAKGHWPEIVAYHLGDEFANSRKHQPCPNGEGTDRYRFRDKSGDGSFFCACSNGSSDGMQLLMCAKGLDFAGACKAVEDVLGPCPRDEDIKPEPRKPTRAERLRSEVVKTKRSAYLSNRGLEVPPGLDWHKSVDYYVDGKRQGQYPGMLAPVMRGDKFVTYHVTYLNGGRKASVSPARKILPAPCPMDGAACPLYPAGETLGIAEGVETAIAAKMIHGVPVWAALNTALMSKFTPPAGVKKVIVFGDTDANYAGHAAGYSLAHRLSGKGFEVELRFPDSLGDWNDVLLRERGAA